MAAFAVAFVFSLLFYLALTAGSGSVLLLWSIEELSFGIILSFFSAFLASKIFSGMGTKPRLSFLSPLKWATFLYYVFVPFFVAMAKANLDVAYRVITGKIRPGIVKISPGLKTDFSTSFLANSITLTPGTLSVDVDAKRDLYIHAICLKTDKPSIGDICGTFPAWARRLAE
jgi:multicomponent Na+:H+ antiporter subunit E